MLYNNNGSESGISGQKENLGRNTSESRLFEERKQNETKYREWEKSIKPITEQNLTENEKQSIKKAKSIYNKLNDTLNLTCRSTRVYKNCAFGDVSKKHR